MSREPNLKDVLDRLDILITLLKLANREAIEEIKKEIKSDPVNIKILEMADGTKEYTVLAKEVARITGKSERWIKEKISRLVEIYALVKRREGGRTYYESSGLYD